jgi:hypothetical protein
MLTTQVTFKKKDRKAIEEAIVGETPPRLPRQYSRELRALSW